MGALSGNATSNGTARFRDRLGSRIAGGHFKSCHNLLLSSIGIGTYLGEPDAATDALYRDAVVRAVELGVNVIDSAINYRCQRGERSVGRALQILISEKGFSREELFIATKGGFIPFDGDYSSERDWLEKAYFKAGLLKKEDISAGCHAMTPCFLADQLAKSLRNLGLETLDAYFLHNPETQLGEIPRPEFLRRMRAAFEFLEKCAAEGKIKRYGLATWQGFLASPEDRTYLSLEDFVVMAREIAGPDHHFQVLEMPYNLAMPEAFTRQNQRVGAGWVSPLEAASRYGFIVMASASLMQGKLARSLPSSLQALFPSAKSAVHCALQFNRSTPGVTTALAGMRKIEHVEENCSVASLEPLAPDEFGKLLTPVS